MSFLNTDTSRAALVGSQRKGEERVKKIKLPVGENKERSKGHLRLNILSRISMNIHMIFCTVAVDQDKVWIRGAKGKGESLCF